jgi:hypothetical protein
MQDANSFIESIKDVILQRLQKKFAATFSLAWLLWNWKIFYLTFVMDHEVYENKLLFIEDNYLNACYLLWYPFLSTVVAIVLFPILNMLSDSWLDKVGYVSKRISISILKQSAPISKEEKAKMLKDFDDRESKLLVDISELKAEHEKEKKRLEEIIVRFKSKAMADKQEESQITKEGLDRFKRGILEFRPMVDDQISAFLSDVQLAKNPVELQSLTYGFVDGVGKRLKSDAKKFSDKRIHQEVAQFLEVLNEEVGAIAKKAKGDEFEIFNSYATKLKKTLIELEDDIITKMENNLNNRA